MFLPQQALIGKPGTWTYYQVLERLHTKARSMRFCMIVYFRFCTGVLPGAQVPGTVVKRSLGTWPYSVDLAIIIFDLHSHYLVPGTLWTSCVSFLICSPYCTVQVDCLLLLLLMCLAAMPHMLLVACCLLFLFSLAA